MKKTFVVLVVALFTGLSLFTSCDESESEAAENYLTDNTWILDDFDTPSEDITAGFSDLFDLFTISYKFKKDNTYTVTTTVMLFVSESETGTWSVSEDGNYLTIDDDISEIFSLTKDELIIGASDAVMGQLDDEEEEGEDTDLYVDVKLVFRAE